MGTPKQLLDVGGTPLLAGVLAEVLASKLDRIVLVLGSESGRIRASLGGLLNHPKMQVVENPRFAEGLSTSLIKGLDAAEEDAQYIMILLADMPHTDRRVIDRLLQKVPPSGLPLGAAALGGRRTHPVMVGRPMFAELLKLTGDTGAKGLFAKYPEQTLLVEMEETYDDRDIDTPEDYASLRGESLETPEKG